MKNILATSALSAAFLVEFVSAYPEITAKEELREEGENLIAFNLQTKKEIEIPAADLPSPVKFAWQSRGLFPDLASRRAFVKDLRMALEREHELATMPETDSVSFSMA